MIYKNINDIQNINFSVIIVGSGPAGISLAIKLAERKIKSLIIEAGSEDYSENSQEFFASKVIGDQINDLQSSRLRQFGGTSAQWGGWSKPMENYNLSSWGVNFDELNKLSDQACEILDIKNNFRKSNINNYFHQTEFQYSNVKFKEKYKNYISKSRFVNLLLNTQVTNFGGSNNIVEYADCMFQKKKIKIYSKIFILSAGGIENSRILLYTQSQNNLLNNEITIGKYWMTHPWFLGGYGILKKRELINFLGSRYIDREGPIHISSTENLKNDKNILSGSIYMDAEENKKLHKEIIKDLLCISPDLGKKIARGIFKKDLKCGNIFLHLEESPNNGNKITLDKNVMDPNGVPITNLHYKKSKQTLISAKTILEEFAEVCRKLDLGRIAINRNIYELEKYESLGVYHHIGGTRIGDRTDNSVVDMNLKVHKTENLFVVGSSVFPTSGYTNPTFTIVQLSLRLGEHLYKKLSDKS